MTEFKIYHNPRCSKSRQTLALLQENGIEPTIVEYLKTPPSVKELTKLLKLLNKTPRELMRKNEVDYRTSGLNNLELSTDQEIELMVNFPKVIERPIVSNNNQAVIGRPPENILDLL